MTTPDQSRDDRTRYGFYLRPSFAICRARAEMHDLLSRQYGLRVAGVFMPHATIKGFFRSDAPVTGMVARLDRALAGRAPFPVHSRGAVGIGRTSVVLDIQHLAGPTNPAPNAPLQALHDAALAALLPLVHPNCDFTPGEWHGPRFQAHLTVAMADRPEGLFDEVLAFVREAEPVGPTDFTADTFHLLAFRSDDWPGSWWDTLRWELLHSWRLYDGRR